MNVFFNLQITRKAQKELKQEKISLTGTIGYKRNSRKKFIV